MKKIRDAQSQTTHPKPSAGSRSTQKSARPLSLPPLSGNQGMPSCDFARSQVQCGQSLPLKPCKQTLRRAWVYPARHIPYLTAGQVGGTQACVRAESSPGKLGREKPGAAVRGALGSCLSEELLFLRYFCSLRKSRGGDPVLPGVNGVTEVVAAV